MFVQSVKVTILSVWIVMEYSPMVVTTQKLSNLGDLFQDWLFLIGIFAVTAVILKNSSDSKIYGK